MHCEYEFYNEAVLDEVNYCMGLAEDYDKTAEMEEAASTGIADFQHQYEATEDKTRICAAFANQFSEFVKP